MKKKRALHIAAFAATVFVAAASAASAQQITGTPGAPSATTTIDGKQLPPPDPKFGGEIKLKAADSKPWWNPRVVPPEGAPNVLPEEVRKIQHAAKTTRKRRATASFRAALDSDSFRQGLSLPRWTTRGGELKTMRCEKSASLVTITRSCCRE